MIHFKGKTPKMIHAVSRENPLAYCLLIITNLCELFNPYNAKPQDSLCTNGSRGLIYLVSFNKQSNISNGVFVLIVLSFVLERVTVIEPVHHCAKPVVYRPVNAVFVVWFVPLIIPIFSFFLAVHLMNLVFRGRG